ncbi:MAG: ATP-dependent Clp protease proteolytic subunit [Phycisphaeraceae bacterium]|nr:ATP-dependent Clp protease proteolytic subunit [Phycisphaeraceae bacterium]
MFGPAPQLTHDSTDGRPAVPNLLPGGMPDPRQPLNMPPMAPGYQRYREMTLDELLLENRIIFMAGEINYASASTVVMKMLHLINIKKNADINLYINSPGGSVDDTLMIYDTMQFIECDVATYCMGRAMSGAAIILASGTKGKRYVLPHAKVMIHQPYGGVYGQTSDVKIQAEQILRDKQRINELLAEKCGRSVEEIAEASERDKYFTAQEAKDWGLVDDIINAKKNADAKPAG